MIGQTILKFDELTSTNDFVKSNILNLDDGTIVLAKTQSKGKGRQGNIWLSPEGNLYFSIFLKNQQDRKNIFSYITKISVSLVTLLSNYNIDVKIKYPNDILINNNKICGILIESFGYEDINAVVLGIGINVNQKDFVDMDYQASSMRMELGKDFDIDSILEEFCSIYNIVEQSDCIHEKYLNSSILLNQHVTYEKNKYFVETIDKQGNIILKNNEKIVSVRYNELAF